METVRITERYFYPDDKTGDAADGSWMTHSLILSLLHAEMA